MPIARFVKTTLLDWERMTCCKLVLSDDGKVPIGEVLEYIDGHLDFLNGVVISGDNPTSQKDLYGILKEIRKRKLSVKLDTNGADPETLDDLMGALLVNCVCVTVPVPPDDPRFEELSGIDAATLRKSLKAVKENGTECHLRTVAVPGLIDRAAVIKIAREAEFAKKFRLIQFDPSAMQGCRLVPYSSNELGEMANAAKGIIKDAGVRNPVI